MEIKGWDGTITLDHEAVTLTFGRMADSAKKQFNPRRIPYTAISSVELAPPKVVRSGYLRLRLAGEPAGYTPPKPVRDINAIEFNTGKAADQMPQVAAAIQQRIAGQIPQPNAALLEPLVGQNATPPPVEQRPDIADALTRAGNTWGNRLEIKRLADILWADETVLELAGGNYNGHVGMVVLTDQRLVFFDQGLISRRVTDFPVKTITSVGVTRSMTLADLTVYASGNKATLASMQQDRADTIARRIRELQQPTAASSPAPATPPAPDVMGQLRQLGELHQAGVLTDEEFQAKKQELLGRL